MVVIVNGRALVENFDFFHRINCLRRLEGAGQSLYLVCTKVGQKTPDRLKDAFYTSHPVDIHGLIHS
jgi:hypothetical protein